MKEIKIGEKIIKLDIGDELRVKDLKKILPIITNQKKGEEIEMILELVKCFGGDTEIIEEMNIQDFTKFSEEFTKLIDTTKEDKKKIVK